MPVSDLEWAVAQFKDNRRLLRYRLARAYYLGDHKLNFSQRRFTDVFKSLFQAVTDNLCPAVIDSVSDRLQVTGFTSTSAERADDGTVTDPPAGRAWELWQHNRMDLRANEVHREALLAGDAYLIVWPDDDGLPVFWPQPAEEIAVEYDPSRPGQLSRAAKLWHDADSYQRLIIFGPDRIERFRGKQRSKTTDIGREGAKRFEPYSRVDADGLERDAATQPNPHGRVPVFHFPNRTVDRYGIGELLDIMPLQDALNKTVCDQLVAQEFSAYRQRYVTGLELEEDAEGHPKPPPWNHGADKMFAATNPDVKFGEFGASDLRQFLEVQETYRAEIARVSGTPLHYLYISKGDFPSGEAMKSAEARFTKKLRDRQTSFGNVWEDAMTFALEMDGSALEQDARLSTVWEDVAPRSEREVAETATLYQALGIPRDALWRRAGFSEQEIQTMLAATGEGADAGQNESLGLLAQRLGLAVNYQVISIDEARRQLEQAGLDLSAAADA